MTPKKQPDNIPQDFSSSRDLGKYKIQYRIPRATINYDQFVQNREQLPKKLLKTLSFTVVSLHCPLLKTYSLMRKCFVKS